MRGPAGHGGGQCLLPVLKTTCRHRYRIGRSGQNREHFTPGPKSSRELMWFRQSLLIEHPRYCSLFLIHTVRLKIGFFHKVWILTWTGIIWNDCHLHETIQIDCLFLWSFITDLYLRFTDVLWMMASWQLQQMGEKSFALCIVCKGGREEIGLSEVYLQLAVILEITSLSITPITRLG